MFRLLVCSLASLALSGGVSLAAEKKDKTVSGEFASYKEGTLTIKVKGKKGEEAKNQEFKVASDVKVITLDGENKKEGTAKDAFTAVKEGISIIVTVGDGDKVTAVQVGAAKKPVEKNKTVSGEFVSYKEGTLTIKVKGKKGEEAKNHEFKVASDVKVITLDGDSKTEGTAKDAFTAVKEGALITVTMGDGDKVIAVQVGTAKKAEKPVEKNKTVSGEFASYKEGTLTIKVKGKKGEEAKNQEFKVASDIKVITLDGDSKTEGTAKDAFTAVKEGALITVTMGDGDKVIAVQVGTAKKGK